MLPPRWLDRRTQVRPTLCKHLEYLAPKRREIPNIAAPKLVRRNPLRLRDQPQQQVLSSDVVVVDTVRFGNAQFDGAFGQFAETDRPRCSLTGRF
jgi:hypothetical protein